MIKFNKNLFKNGKTKQSILEKQIIEDPVLEY